MNTAPADSESITIIIPCYNQPEMLGRCLRNIRYQSYKNYKVLLVDDCSTVSYEGVLQANADMRLSRMINKVNLGSMQNLFYCIRLPVDTDYSIVFHEDDLMHPFLIECLLSVLQKDGRLIAAGCQMSFFRDHYDLMPRTSSSRDIEVTTYMSRTAWCWTFLRDATKFWLNSLSK
jgi:glycosyltransferase involved in cell wall biosynthesis